MEGTHPGRMTQGDTHSPMPWATPTAPCRDRPACTIPPPPLTLSTPPAAAPERTRRAPRRPRWATPQKHTPPFRLRVAFFGAVREQ
eukprot:1192003-Prorocentrum_minimum.AAC.3